MSDVALRAILPPATTPQELFVSSGWLRWPKGPRGNWTAYLESSSKVAPAEMTPASIEVRREDGSAPDVFSGTVRRAKANPGTEKLVVTVVGGAGGLLTPLPPLDSVQGSAGVPAGAIARAICDAAGEVLAPGVEAALDLVTLPRWHRATDTTGAVALDLLAWQLGVPWRMLPVGQITMGADAWPAVSGAVAGGYWTGLVEDDGGVIYAVRGAPWQPGQAIDGLQAVDVRYDLAGSSLTATVRGAVAGDPPHAPDLGLYRGAYSANVVAQNADGTIDVRADDARIGDLRSLAFRCGLPGALVTFDPTSSPPPRVRVRFDGASPAGAFAEGADQDAAATAAVALVGDSGGYLSGTCAAAPGPVTLLLSPTPTGNPGEVHVVVLGPGSQRVKLR